MSKRDGLLLGSTKQKGKFSQQSHFAFNFKANGKSFLCMFRLEKATSAVREKNVSRHNELNYAYLCISYLVEYMGPVLVNEMKSSRPHPFKSGQIEFMVSKDAQYSETCAKNNFLIYFNMLIFEKINSCS